jgi:Tn3 transposase DDE domain
LDQPGMNPPNLNPLCRTLGFFVQGIPVVFIKIDILFSDRNDSDSYFKLIAEDGGARKGARFDDHTAVSFERFATFFQELRPSKLSLLCLYLNSMELEREINEGLIVIEHWNGAADFVNFGKGCEMASNRIGDQEISRLSLYLVQLSLVYVNTLMIEQVLEESAWQTSQGEHIN